MKADAGRTDSVCPNDGFGRRTIKVFLKRTETDGGQIPLVRLKDGFGRRTLKKFESRRRTKADQVRPTSPGYEQERIAGKFIHVWTIFQSNGLYNVLSVIYVLEFLEYYF